MLEPFLLLLLILRLPTFSGSAAGKVGNLSCLSSHSIAALLQTVDPPCAAGALIALTVLGCTPTLAGMVVRLKPETESRLQELAATTGRAPEELVEDAMAGFLAELGQVREMLDGRYDEIKSGRVKPVEGEEGFKQLRRKSEDRRRR